jgi:hypothetical protein
MVLSEEVAMITDNVLDDARDWMYAHQRYTDAVKLIDECVSLLCTWYAERMVLATRPIPQRACELADTLGNIDADIFQHVGGYVDETVGFQPPPDMNVYATFAEQLSEHLGVKGCLELHAQACQQDRTMWIGCAAGHVLRNAGVGPHDPERKHMPTTTRGRLVGWLQSLTGITNVKAGTLKFAGHEYPAAQYERVLREQDGGKPDVFVYVIGERPNPVKKGRVCFNLMGSPDEWFVAAHYEGDVTDIHPFGPHWLITPWSLPGKIDADESKPYRRDNMEFVEGDPDVRDE